MSQKGGTSKNLYSIFSSETGNAFLLHIKSRDFCWGEFVFFRISITTEDSEHKTSRKLLMLFVSRGFWPKTTHLQNSRPFSKVNRTIPQIFPSEIGWTTNGDLWTMTQTHRIHMVLGQQKIPRLQLPTPSKKGRLVVGVKSSVFLPGGGSFVHASIQWCCLAFDIYIYIFNHDF